MSQRHRGIAGTGARVEEASGLTSIITNQDEFVTVEWLELAATSGGGTAGFYVTNNVAASNTVTVRNLLVHDLTGSGILNVSTTVVLYAYNNILYDNGYGIRNTATAYASGLSQILNNTVYSSNTGPGISSTNAAGTPYTTLINNIATGNAHRRLRDPERDLLRRIPLLLHQVQPRQRSGAGTATTTCPPTPRPRTTARAGMSFGQAAPTTTAARSTSRARPPRSTSTSGRAATPGTEGRAALSRASSATTSTPTHGRAAPPGTSAPTRP